jgi:prevent-host-death family protein
MRKRTISVTEFKAKCLALLDGIGEGGGSITVTKRGRPIATVGPAHRAHWKSPEGVLEGKVVIDEELLTRDTTDLREAAQATPPVKKAR